MSRVKKLSLQLECQYSDTELAEKRDALANVIIGISSVEDRRKSAMSGFKEELDYLYGKSSKLARQIKARSEHRLTECAVEYHKPNVNEKTTIRLDTGELLKTELMTEDERQEDFDFGIEENREIQRMIDEAHGNEPPTDQPTPPAA